MSTDRRTHNPYSWDTSFDEVPSPPRVAPSSASPDLSPRSLSSTPSTEPHSAPPTPPAGAATAACDSAGCGRFVSHADVAHQHPAAPLPFFAFADAASASCAALPSDAATEAPCPPRWAMELPWGRVHCEAVPKGRSAVAHSLARLCAADGTATEMWFQEDAQRLYLYRTTQPTRNHKQQRRVFEGSGDYVPVFVGNGPPPEAVTDSVTWAAALVEQVALLAADMGIPDPAAHPLTGNVTVKTTPALPGKEQGSRCAFLWLRADVADTTPLLVRLASSEYRGTDGRMHRLNVERRQPAWADKVRTGKGDRDGYRRRVQPLK